MRLSYSIQEQRISFHLFKLSGFFISYSLQRHPSLTLRSLAWVASSLIRLRRQSGHMAQVLSTRAHVGFRTRYTTRPRPMSIINLRIVSVSVRKKRHSARFVEVIECKAPVVWKEPKNKVKTKEKIRQGMEWIRCLTTVLVHQDPALPDHVSWSQYIYFSLRQFNFNFYSM